MCQRIKHDKPDIFNTDQGSQYTGKAFTGILQDQGIRISMNGKGRAMDNISIERLWRSVKYEEIYLKEYATVKELINALRQYFKFYNFERPHQSLEGKTPGEAESLPYIMKSGLLNNGLSPTTSRIDSILIGFIITFIRYSNHGYLLRLCSSAQSLNRRYAFNLL